MLPDQTATVRPSRAVALSGLRLAELYSYCRTGSDQFVWQIDHGVFAPNRANLRIRRDAGKCLTLLITLQSHSNHITHTSNSSIRLAALARCQCNSGRVTGDQLNTLWIECVGLNRLDWKRRIPRWIPH